LKFVIFAEMKNAVKQSYLLFLALSLTLVLADCNFIDNAFSNFSIGAQRESSDLPVNSHHSNTICFEDEILMGDLIVKPTLFTGFIRIVPTLNANFKSRYISSIWQPPKFS